MVRQPEHRPRRRVGPPSITTSAAAGRPRGDDARIPRRYKGVTIDAAGVGKSTGRAENNSSPNSNDRGGTTTTGSRPRPSTSMATTCHSRSMTTQADGWSSRSPSAPRSWSTGRRRADGAVGQRTARRSRPSSATRPRRGQRRGRRAGVSEDPRGKPTSRPRSTIVSCRAPPSSGQAQNPVRSPLNTAIHLAPTPGRRRLRAVAACHRRRLAVDVDDSLVASHGISR